jgi:ribosomal protein S18 acetylase RimI-like enzyme
MTGARVAVSADLEAMGRTLGRAFADDPVMVWTVGDGEGCDPEKGAIFFRLDARNHLRHGLCFVTPDADGVSIWAPPGRWKTRPLDLLRTAPRLLRLAPVKQLRRALAFVSTVEAAHPAEPHYYLAVLGTDPDARGRGLGVTVMAPVLERADREGRPCYLESSKEDNLAYYERHGFKVTGQIDHPGAPPLWSMWREPVRDRRG